MFTTVPEGGKIAMALELRGKTMDDYAQWVKDDKVGSANDVRRFLENLGNLHQVKINTRLMRHSRQVQRAIGRTARRRHHRGCVLH